MPHALIVLFVAQSFHVFLNGKPRMTVRDALHEAVDLLDRPGCARVFQDFRNSHGEPLSQALDASGLSPREWLSELYFVDGEVARCRADETMALYTTPGSRVIWVCGDRFAERFAMNLHAGAVLLIHELLHAAGLGENPPSSAQITAIVARRCER